MNYRIQVKKTTANDTSTSFVREHNVVWMSTNKAEADTKRRLLQNSMNGPNATAYYTYWVV